MDPGDGSGARILVVEDDDMSRDLLRRRLQRHRFEVLVAHDGFQGLALARHERPDVVLMDIGLPGMDGLETTRQLKGDDRTRHIPVIALTAHAMAGDEEKARDAGCDDYDTKPVEFERLLAKISRVVEGR
jgi:two-component system cell cycle response regulator DivK